MMTARLSMAAFVTAALLAAPSAGEAKKYKHISHYVTSTQSYSAATTGLSPQQPRTYGSSGPSIGTVTAPSVGSYYWPSVGVTNSVPTWSNTNPPVR